MVRALDLTGQRFGKLVAVERDGVTGKKKVILWKCACDCGKTVHRTVDYLRGSSNQEQKSCGCTIQRRLKYTTEDLAEMIECLL